MSNSEMIALGGSMISAPIPPLLACSMRSAYHPNELPSQIWQRLVNTAEGPNRVVNAYAAITYAPLSVSIWGDNTPPVNTTQTWYAAAANGTGPYSYTWYRDGVFAGTGDSYTEDVYDTTPPFQLQVTVTDAVGGSATSSMLVSPSLN